MPAFNARDTSDHPGGFPPLPNRGDQQPQSRSKKVKTGLWIVGAIVLLIFSMVWNPPTGKVHSFTSASDYKASTDSGCTNSGKGCHGSETAYKDFNDYHKNAKCTTCHEYQGVGCIPCHKPTGHECQTCHDGTMEGAPDRNRITDAYPKGHYRETTHTATATDMGAVVRGADDGEAGAACNACHARDLYAAHQKVPETKGSDYGDTVGCGECHNDTRSSGLRQVLSKWKGRRCEDCHTKKSSTPIHALDIAASVEASGAAKCGSTGTGCHDDANLHALHADAPKDCAGSAGKGEPGCHELKLQAMEPTVTACGQGAGESCHPDYVNDDYTHKRDQKVHSAKNRSLAGDRRYGDTACSACHDMADDGMSLVVEHERPNNALASASPNTCQACHDANDATAETVADGWKERSTTRACEACHDADKIDARHEDSASAHKGVALTASGAASPSACKASGCHTTLDLRELHKASGCATKGCHGNTGDIRGLSRTSCGGSSSSKACHAGVHDSAKGLHVAGRKQASALYLDAASGNAIACLKCHSMRLDVEHSRSNSAIAGGSGTVCARCHNATSGTRTVVDGGWTARGTASACTACHRVAGGISAPHTRVGDVHFATEIDATGTAEAGYCATTGCHPSNDVRIVHKAKGCTIDGCHQPSGDIRGANRLRCGGSDELDCHADFTASSHGQDHSADLTGTVTGITYSTSQNVGCFGCHYRDLTLEHSRALQAGSMEGGGASSCRVCHAGPVSADNGKYADLSAVRAAIATGDRRCVACHSGGDSDGETAVASPHREFSTDTSQPAGAVWSDPLEDWKTALNATTGGGHNALSASAVGAYRDKKFPITEVKLDDTTYNWPLTRNSGNTAWLRTGEIEETAVAGLPVMSFPSATTTEGIQSAMVTCDNCHAMDDPVGPQGAQVKISIDPAFAQTEYSNPTSGTFQFDPFNIDSRNKDNPDGYKPVICVKCHLVYARSRPATTAVYVGGFSYHSTHASRHDTDPNTPGTQPEQCISCHVRIPHAWKRPRLLRRTVAATATPEAIAPDEWPFVLPGDRGMTGVVLTNITDPAAHFSDKTCGTGGGPDGKGGCGGGHAHAAEPSGTVSYWP